ncbi:hypothetical protein D3C85_1113080 [compost metagenome]
MIYCALVSILIFLFGAEFKLKETLFLPKFVSGIIDSSLVFPKDNLKLVVSFPPEIARVLLKEYPVR